MPTDHEDLFKRLAEPFPPHRIGHLRKGNKTLSYITARVVQERLDDVLGPENWRVSFREWRSEDTLCRLEIRLPGTQEWIAKEDGADEADISSTKSGFSGSFKRAAVHFGIGRSLYPETPFEDEPREQAKPQAVSEPPKPPRPDWFGEPCMVEGYFDMPWQDAWDREGFDFLGDCQRILEEVRIELNVKKSRKPNVNDERLRDAVAYMESRA